MEYPNGRMSDGEIRLLCNRFFDAYQDHKIEEVADTIADNCVVWLGPFNKTVEREEWLKATIPSWGIHRHRTYNDRQIDTFDGGFVIRYSLNITYFSGETQLRHICIVGLCRAGKITRIDEYMDTQHIKGWTPPAPPSQDEQRRMAQEALTRENRT